MFWYELLSNPEILKNLYSNIPDLDKVDLLQLELKGSSSMILVIDLLASPDKSSQCCSKKYNSIILNLELSPIKDIFLEKWDAYDKNPVHIKIETATNHSYNFQVTAKGEKCSFYANVDAIKINKIDGYYARHEDK